MQEKLSWFPGFQVCNDFQLDRDRRWERCDFNSGPGRVRFPLAGEILGVEFVVDREILFHVREEHGDIDDVLPTRACVFQHEPDIFKNGAALRCDVVVRDVAGVIERYAGNLSAAAHPWSNPGEKKKIADTLRMRKRADWFWRSRALEGFAQA